VTFLKCLPIWGKMRIWYKKYVFQRVLYQTLLAIRFDHAPSKPIYLTWCAIVYFDVSSSFWTSVPSRSDHQIDWYIDRYQIGCWFKASNHCSQDAFAYSSKKSSWTVEIVDPTWKRLFPWSAHNWGSHNGARNVLALLHYQKLSDCFGVSVSVWPWANYFGR